MKTQIFVFMMLTSSQLLSADMSHINFQSSITSTRDNFSLREYSLSWMKNRRYSGWDYTGEADSGFDYGIKTTIRNGSGGTSLFKGNQLDAIIGNKWSKKSSTYLAVGVHQLENRSSSIKHSTVPYSLEHNQLVGKWLNSKLTYTSDWNYQELQLGGALESFIKKETIHHSFLLTPVNNVRISLRGRNSDYSDGNSSYHQDLDLKYKIGPSETWYLLGAGVEYTRFESKRSDYWTPRQFIGLGPRFELVQPFAKKFQVSLAANLNRFQEESNSWGNGFYSNFALQYGKRDETNVLVGYERIQSSQSGTLWYSDRLFLSANHFY